MNDFFLSDSYCFTIHDFYFSFVLGFEIEISDKIKELFTQYGKGSNFRNNLNVSAFINYLEGSLDPSLDIKFIEDGYSLYLITDGTELKPVCLTQKVANMATTKREFIKIIDQLIKELQSGAVIPSTERPKYIINLFCVPKKDSATGLMTKLRVVRHGSFPRQTQQQLMIGLIN